MCACFFKKNAETGEDEGDEGESMSADQDDVIER
jgi:hypothetical protein